MNYKELELEVTGHLLSSLYSIVDTQGHFTGNKCYKATVESYTKEILSNKKLNEQKNEMKQHR